MELPCRTICNSRVHFSSVSYQVGEVNVVESVRRSRVTGSLVGSDGSASMHGEHVELYSEEESSTGEEEEEEEEEEEVVVETYDLPESIENRPPTAGKVPWLLADT